jgi:molybdopterin synthase sulfur carrier subunit
MAKVVITQHLYTFFPDLRGRELSASGATVAEVLRELEAIAPGIGFYLCDERGRLRQHVNIFIGDERVTDRQKLSDRVAADATVTIMQALSGG